MNIRLMSICDYNEVFCLWLNASGVGLNTVDDSLVGSALLESALRAIKEEGIAKVYILVYNNNEQANTFWKNRGFRSPQGIIFYTKAIAQIV